MISLQFMSVSFQQLLLCVIIMSVPARCRRLRQLRSTPACEQAKSKFCRCDSDCRRYSDCCATHRLARRLSAQKTAKCFYDDNGNWFLMVHRCRRNSFTYWKRACKLGMKFNGFFGLTPERSCLDRRILMLGSVPVWNRQTRVIYANKFCALCNGEKAKHLIRPKFYKKCHQYKQSGSTRYTFLPIIPENLKRKCHRDYVDTCKDKPTEACKSQQNSTMIHVETTWRGRRNTTFLFLNRECCRCNQNYLERLTSIPQICKNETIAKVFRNESKRVTMRLTTKKSSIRIPYMFNIMDWISKIQQSRIQLANTSLNNVDIDGILQNQTLSSHVKVASVIYTVLSSTSLILLLCLIKMVFFTRKFDQPGGKLTGVFAILLFLVRTVLMVDYHWKIPHHWYFTCQIWAVFKHYMILSCFFWMTSFAANILYSFVSKHTRTHNEDSPCHLRLIIMLGISFGGPAVIVTASALINYLAPPANQMTTAYLLVKSAYGFNINSRNCWFTLKGSGILFWYFTPIALLLLTNVVISVLLFRHIKKNEFSRMIKVHAPKFRQNKKHSKRDNNNNNNNHHSHKKRSNASSNNSAFCFKLCVLFGFFSINRDHRRIYKE